MLAIFPKIAECAASENTERLAVMVRKYFGGSQVYAPQLDVAQIYLGLGLPIQEYPLDGIAALVGRDEKGAFELAAVVNPKARLDRKERAFALASLLGHFFFFIQPKILRGEWSNNGVKELVHPSIRYASGSTTQGLNSKDLIADQFAACLLMPAAFVKRAADELGQSGKLAKFFGVSEKVMIRRLIELNCTVMDLPKLDSSIKHATSNSSENAKPTQNSKHQEPAKPSELRGIERIREIARRLDQKSP